MSSFNGTCTEVAIQPSVFNGTSIEVADSTPPMCYGQCLALPSLRTLYWYRIEKLIHNEPGFLYFPVNPPCRTFHIIFVKYLAEVGHFMSNFESEIPDSCK